MNIQVNENDRGLLLSKLIRKSQSADEIYSRGHQIYENKFLRFFYLENYGPLSLTGINFM